MKKKEKENHTHNMKAQLSLSFILKFMLQIKINAAQCIWTA